MIFPSRLSGVNVKTRLLHDQHPHSMTGIVRSSPESPARQTLELPMIKQSSRVIAGNAMLAFMFIHSCKGVLFHRIKAGFVFMSSSLVTCQIIRFRDSVVSLFPGTLLRMSLLSVTQPHVSFFHARKRWVARLGIRLSPTIFTPLDIVFLIFNPYVCENQNL